VPACQCQCQVRACLPHSLARWPQWPLPSLLRGIHYSCTTTHYSQSLTTRTLLPPCSPADSSRTAKLPQGSHADGIWHPVTAPRRHSSAALYPFAKHCISPGAVAKATERGRGATSAGQQKAQYLPRARTAVMVMCSSWNSAHSPTEPRHTRSESEIRRSNPQMCRARAPCT
jgi:hypothetical protein